MSLPNPLSAYETALIRRGYAPDAVKRRLRVAGHILAAMVRDDPPQHRYREAVERLLMSLGDPARRAWCQKIAREFYPFYVDAGCPLPSGAGTQSAQAMSVSIELPPNSGLDDLIQQAMDRKLVPAETKALKAYVHELKQMRRPRQDIDHRQAIVRLLLLALHGLPHDGRHYRAAIESLLPLFSHNETRAYFLGVVREFHPHYLSLAPKPSEP